MIVVCIFTSSVQVAALDPVTIATLAPEASNLAAQWAPYAFSGLGSTAAGLVEIGKATVNIFRLPLGLLQCTLGGPFGMFGAGVSNLAMGGLAPVQLIYHTLMLPLRMISLGAVR